MSPFRIGRWAASAVLAVAAATFAAAESPTDPADRKAFDKLVVDTLRDVHNKGADLYNASKDYVGSFRIYEGALRTIRPLLAYRPSAQKMIDDGLAASDREADPARRAFILHETIEKARAYLKTAAASDPMVLEPKKKEPVKEPPPETTTPKVKPKKPDEPTPMTIPIPKKKETTPKSTDTQAPKKPASGLSGKVTLAGKPAAKAELMLVSLTLAKPRVFTATAQDDGSYSLKDEVPPGKYAVVVTGKGVPAKFGTTTTSGVVVEVKAGGGACNVVLK